MQNQSRRRYGCSCLVLVLVVIIVVVLQVVSYAVSPPSTRRAREEVLTMFVRSLILLCSSVVVLADAGFRLVVLLVALPGALIQTENPSNQYKGKVILILGASSGIGKDIALISAEKGAHLVLAARRLSRLEEVADDCRKLGASQVDIIQVDVSVEEQTKVCMERVKKLYNRLDLLVLNAAIPGPWANVEDIKEISMLYDLMSVNYWGYVVPTVQSLPLLIRSPHAHIIVVSSMYGHVISPYQAGYAAAKHAIHGFFDSIREEISALNSSSLIDGSGGRRIGVTIHCPGGIATEVLSKFQTANANVKEFFIPNFFLGDSLLCARSIMEAYEADVKEAFYPAYAAGFTAFRDVFPDLFDQAYHWITHFYTDYGIFHFS